jgi:hypothetical protein
VPIEVGRGDGCNVEGECVGSIDGKGEGREVGIADGKGVGSVDGTIVLTAVGIKVGM